MFIVFDGPEKSGKTTLINEVYRALHKVEVNCIIKKWGPVFPDDRVYLEEATQDAASDLIVLWDRCWASEHVYATLLHRIGRRLRHFPEVGEFEYGRLATLKYMVLPAMVEMSAHLRDGTDLAVNLIEEYKLFKDYARKFAWYYVFNDFTTTGLESNVKYVLNRILYEKRGGGELISDNCPF
jgi:hypothetical protein